MFSAFANVRITADQTAQLGRILEQLTKAKVYVGVPEGAERSDEITNAELLYIQTHGVRAKSMREEMNPRIESGEMAYSQAYELYIQSHGSPLWYIPPRPVVEPAIEKNMPKLAKQMQKAAVAALDGNDIAPELHRAGMMGQNYVRGYFTDPANGWPANAPATVEAKGSDRPLIDTGELRKAITYAVEGVNT
jgi:hypothetical protein